MQIPETLPTSKNKENTDYPSAFAIVEKRLQQQLAT